MMLSDPQSYANDFNRDELMDQLIVALRFYAERNNYCMDEFSWSPIDEDNGRKAREALGLK